MIIRYKKLFLITLLGFTKVLLPTHNTNRFFPLLELPTTYPQYKRVVDVNASVLFAASSGAWGSGDSRIGLYDLTNKYDLKDVIYSQQQYTEKILGQTYTNPFLNDFPGSNKYINQSIKYDISGRVKAEGGMFKVECHSPWKGLAVGFYLPVLRVSSNQNFILNQKDSVFPFAGVGHTIADGEVSQIDRVRREVQANDNLQGPDYVKTGIGDMDIYLKYSRSWNHKFLLNKINATVQGGFLVPTGEKSDFNSPASVPFMGNGHFGTYIDFNPEFEFKESWKLGFMFGLVYQFSTQRQERMPVANEPMIFSALSGDLRVKPGMLFKISPYFNVAGLADGLNLQLRWTWLKHCKDHLYDYRSQVERTKLASNLGAQETFTDWRANYLSLQVVYDSFEGMKKWALKPKFFATYDFPFNWIGGRFAPKAQQVAIGVELSF